MGPGPKVKLEFTNEKAALNYGRPNRRRLGIYLNRLYLKLRKEGLLRIFQNYLCANHTLWVLCHHKICLALVGKFQDGGIQGQDSGHNSWLLLRGRP